MRQGLALHDKRLVPASRMSNRLGALAYGVRGALVGLGIGRLRTVTVAVIIPGAAIAAAMPATVTSATVVLTVADMALAVLPPAAGVIAATRAGADVPATAVGDIIVVAFAFLVPLRPITAIAAFAKEYGITHIVMGRTRRPWYRRWFSPSILERLLEAVEDADVIVVGNPSQRA